MESNDFDRKPMHQDNVFLDSSEGFAYDTEFGSDTKVSMLNHFVQSASEKKLEDIEKEEIYRL